MRTRWRRSKARVWRSAIVRSQRMRPAGSRWRCLQHDPASDRPPIQLSREGGIPRLPSLGIRFRF